jgi:putative transposase
MIDRDHDLPVTRQAQLLGMSRGAVYYLPRPTSATDLALMRRIDELHLEHPFMGARQLRRQLQREGVGVGRRHVTTLMQRMGIEALAPQPGTSQRAPGHKIYPYLLRKLAVLRSNQVWALDTTYIPMARGFVYLTAVADVASRRVLAHKVAITLGPVILRRSSSRPSPAGARPRSSIPNRAVSSRPASSLKSCSPGAAS